MLNVEIKGIGCYAPENIVKYDNGERRHSTGEDTQLSMGVEAAKRALANADLSIEDIDCIVAASAVCMQPIPCNAALYHEALALGSEIPALDISTTCTSFITAMDTMSYLIEAGRYKNVLIISSELASIALNPNENSHMLFSDGAAAIVLSKSSNKKIFAATHHTCSEGAHSTEIKAGGTLRPPYEYIPEKIADYQFHMDGLRIVHLSVKKLPKFFDEFLLKTNLTIDDIDMVIPHQASPVLPSIMKKLKISEGKYIDYFSEFGNMVSASVPYALCKAIERGRIKRGDKVALIGTAAGLTINMLAFEY